MLMLWNALSVSELLLLQLMLDWTKMSPLPGEFGSVPVAMTTFWVASWP